MQEIKDYLSWIEPESLWMVQVFTVVLITAIANLLVKKLIVRLLKQSGKTKTRWDDIVIHACSQPVNWIVWLIGLGLASRIIYHETQSQIFASADTIRDIGILVSITWFILGLIKGTEQDYIHNQRKHVRMDKHTIEAVSKLIRLATIITAGLIILQNLGYSISGVLAFGGVGGIAIGFAAKDLLANFFGGLIVYLDRPFATGDWIRSPDRKIEGTVEKIGWRVTQIRTFDKRPLYVPNSIFTTIIVENPSRMANRRIYETIGLRYDDIKQIQNIVKSVKGMLKQHPEIDTAQTMIVNFNEFSDSSVDFFVYTFTKTTDWVLFHEIKQDVLLKIAEIIEQNQAEIAFPTQTLHLQSQNNAEYA